MARSSYSANDYVGGAIAAVLNPAISSSDTTITITGADVTWGTLGSAGGFFLAIDYGLITEEKVYVPSGSYTWTNATVTITGITRGQDGTTAQSHTVGSSVVVVLTATDLKEANYAVQQTVGKVTTAGDVLYASGANSLARLSIGTQGQVLTSNGSTPYWTSGAQGPQGAQGLQASVSVGTVTTGSQGSSATVTNVGTSSAAILNFGIPQGYQGAQGFQGAAGQTNAHLSVAVVDDSGATNAGAYAVGSTGADGGTGVGATITANANGVLTIGTYTPVYQDRILVAANTNSKYNGVYTLSTVGTSSIKWVLTRATDYDNHVAGQVEPGDYFLVIYGADAGKTYIQVNNGSLTGGGIKIGTDNITFTETGGVGPTGPQGSSATVAIGTTTTGAQGTQALVTNTGTSSAATFNFTIPQGYQGAAGSQGAQGASYITSSTTPLTIGTGSISITVGTNLAYTVGSGVLIYNSSSNYMNGNVTAYSSSTGAMTVNVTSVTGSGTFSTWTVNLAGLAGSAGAQGNQGGLTIGTTTTVSYATGASVSNSGTAGAAVLNFSIPQGPQGVQGTAASTSVSTKTSAYTLASTDNGNIIVLTSAATITLPSSGFTAGQSVTIVAATTGCSISGTSGSVISTGATQNAPTLRTTGAVATAIYLGTVSGYSSTTWLVTGDIA